MRFFPLVFLALGACTLNLGAVHAPPETFAAPTAFPWTSVVYAVRTEAGVVVVDLGWYGAGGALRRALAEMGAEPEDVTDVFLTHSHRDHIGAWRTVQHARFHLATDEVPLFVGAAHHPDLPSRVGELALGNPAPWPGEVALRPFSTDTTFVFGADTLRAFVVSGHTAGSAAYLLRGVLFVGDAVYRSYLTGYGAAAPVFTDDPERSRASLAVLFEKVGGAQVRWVCTAHGKCARPDERFLRKVLR